MEQSTQLFYQLEEQVRKNSLKQNLYIQNTPNNFLIMITDERGNIKVLQEHTKENFITDWTFLNLRFKSTTLVTFSNSFVLLPKELASLNFEGGFSPFMVTDQPLEQSGIPEINTETCYTVPLEVQTLRKEFSNSKIVPSSNILISHTRSVAKESGEQIGLYLYKDQFEIAFIKDKEFIFYNLFPKASIADFNYYLLSVCKQFDIKPAHATFYLSGLDSQIPDSFECLGKYTQNIVLSAANDHAINSLSLDHNVQHAFFLLSEQSQCDLLVEN